MAKKSISSREPEKVIILLETVFSAFDAIAERKGIFKGSLLPYVDWASSHPDMKLKPLVVSLILYTKLFSAANRAVVIQIVTLPQP